MTNRVLSRLLEEIKKKTSWGKNELIELFARVQAEEIDTVNVFTRITCRDDTEDFKKYVERVTRE